MVHLRLQFLLQVGLLSRATELDTAVGVEAGDNTLELVHGEAIDFLLDGLLQMSGGRAEEDIREGFKGEKSRSLTTVTLRPTSAMIPLSGKEREEGGKVVGRFQNSLSPLQTRSDPCCS